MEPCLFNSTTNATCQSILSYTILNESNCPTMTYTPSDTTIEYSGASNPGTATYVVQLWNNTGSVMLSSQSTTISDGSAITGTFTGLTTATGYKLRVVVTVDGVSTVCPFSAVTTT
jgi:hypothetical protein